LLVRITWGLLLAGLVFLIVGFLTDDSNVFLIISIVIELAVIVLVLGAWARRAREASAEGFTEVPALSAEPEEDELYASLSDDEEFAVGGRRTQRVARRPARRPAPRKAGAKPAAKPKAKPAAERTAKLKPAKAKASKPKASKPKAAARKAKAKPKAKAAGTARPKAKPARRRPPAR
jgi:FtsZ-interacting cell division protein ZipA